MKTRNYRFNVNTPSKKVVSVIVTSTDPVSARSDAYTALHSVFGPIARVVTSAEDAKVMRRMPNNLEPVRNCRTTSDNGAAQYWAWLVYTD